MKKIEANLFGDDAVFFVHFDTTDPYFKHINIEIRYQTYEEETRYLFRHDRHSDIAITSQIDMDSTQIYTVCLSVLGNNIVHHRNIGRFYNILSTISKRVIKYLAKNMRPVTFGQFVFMIGHVTGIEEIVFTDRNGFNTHTLSSGCQVLDSRIRNMFPHITDAVSFHEFG